MTWEHETLSISQTLKPLNPTPDHILEVWPHWFDIVNDAFRFSEVCIGQMMSSTMRTWGSGITCSPPTMCWASLAVPAPTLSFASVPLLKQVCFACCGHKLACYNSCALPLCVWLTAQSAVGVLKLALGVGCVLPLYTLQSTDNSGVHKALRVSTSWQPFPAGSVL